MPFINVLQKFVLNHETSPGHSREFLPGRHEVDQEVADHWFVKLMSGIVGAPRDGALGVVDARVAAENEARVAALRLKTEQEAVNRAGAMVDAHHTALVEAEARAARAEAALDALRQEQVAAQQAVPSDDPSHDGPAIGAGADADGTLTDEQLRDRARAEAKAATKAAADAAAAAKTDKGRAATKDQ